MPFWAAGAEPPPMRYAADLHIHSCLSPCGELSMSPREIARRARAAGLDMAAVTDHNSALNAPAFAAACAGEGITPVFGIEVTTREEVHVLALFEKPDEALELGRIIYAALPPIMNDPEKFGDQVYVDLDENIIGEVDKFLVSAADISLDELAEYIRGLNGLFIPAHVDRPSFSLSSQLGFIPPMAYSALEVTASPPSVDTGACVLVANSDAHHPDGVGRRRTFFSAPGLAPGTTPGRGPGPRPGFADYRRALLEGRVKPEIPRR